MRNSLLNTLINSTYFKIFILLIILICGNIFALYPFSTHLKDSSPDNPDDVLLNSYIMQWEYNKIVSLDFTNYFNTTYFYPYENTLAFTEHHTISQLFFFPLISIFRDPVLVHNLIVLIALVLNGLFMYLFIYKLTSSFIPSLLSAVLFSFVPYRYTHLVHLNVLHWWTIPLCFMSAQIFVESLDLKSTLLFSFSLLCLPLWSNNIAAFFIIPFSIFFIYISLERRSISNKRFYLLLSMSLLFVLLVSSPFLYHYLRLREEMFFERFLFDIRYYSPELQNFIGVHDTNIFWGETLGRFGKWERYLFPGATFLIIFFISILNIYRSERRRFISIFIIIAITTFFLSLGPYIDGSRGDTRGPYYLLLKYVPGYYGIRVPTRFAILMYFAMATICGLGLADLIKRWERSKYINSLLKFIFVMAALFSIYEGSHRINLRVPLNHPEKDVIYQKIRELPDGVLFEYPAIFAYKDAAQTFASLYHNKRTYNGYSGWGSKYLENLIGAVKNYSPIQLINILKDANVRYFLVRGYIPSEIYNKLEHLLDYSSDVRLISRWGRDLLFEIDNGSLNELNLDSLDSKSIAFYFPSCVKGGERVNGGIVIDGDDKRFYVSKRRRYRHSIELYDTNNNKIREDKADVVAYNIYENGKIHLLIKYNVPDMEREAYIRLKGWGISKPVKISKDCNTELSDAIEVSDIEIPDNMRNGEPLTVSFELKNKSRGYIKSAVDIDDFTTDGVVRVRFSIEGVEDDNKNVRYDLRYPIYSDMASGDSIYFRQALPLNFKEGRYRIDINIVSEKRFWFSQKGFTPIVREFNVSK